MIYNQIEKIKFGYAMGVGVLLGVKMWWNQKLIYLDYFSKNEKNVDFAIVLKLGFFFLKNQLSLTLFLLSSPHPMYL